MSESLPAAQTPAPTTPTSTPPPPPDEHVTFFHGETVFLKGIPFVVKNTGRHGLLLSLPSSAIKRGCAFTPNHAKPAKK